MKVSLRWLQEFIDLPTDDPDQLAEVFASLGHEVEGVERIEAPFTGVVVGTVEHVEPHPNADRLRYCRVQVGDGTVHDVVCGAWNFEEGAVVPVSLPGAKLANGLEVGLRTIRGIQSFGMICSEVELGIGEDAEGILVLDDQAAAPGTDFATLLPYPDVVFDLSITPNRPDAMSIHGIARDLGAYFGIPVTVPPTDVTESEPESDVVVEIEDPQGAPRYVGREVRDVSVGRSPLWMRLRLRDAGVRPISNIVDITNYVLLELGQPLHGFDLEKVVDHRVVVRRARAEEHLRTLDGVDRALSEEDLVIADPDGPIAIAGVMGGEASEVGEDTRRVLIEAAHFDPASVLYTAKRHGLRTEASARFERGVDPALPPLAANRAARLMAELAGGTVVAPLVDEYPNPHQPVRVEFPVSEVARLTGVSLAADEVASILTRLGFGVSGDEVLTCVVPSFRPDVSRPADLVEEVARLYGYDKIPERIRVGTGEGFSAEDRLLRRVAAALTGMGIFEATTLSFTSESAVRQMGHEGGVIEVRNPLRDDQSVLRPTLLPGLLDAVRFNLGYGAKRVALFETGRVFLNRPADDDPRVPAQPLRLGIVVLGPLQPSGPDSDVFVATAILRALAEHLGIPIRLEQSERLPMHPGRGATVVSDDTPIGIVGELHPSIGKTYGIGDRCAILELDLEPLLGRRGWRQFEEPSSFPPVVIDLAFDLAESVPYESLEQVVFEAGGEPLESARLFDVFQGPPLEPGRRSLAVQIVLRAHDRTLTTEDAVRIRERIVAAVADRLGGRLRGA